MIRLRRSLLGLLVVQAIFFNIERLDFGQTNLVDIQSFVYGAGILAVVATFAVPALYRSRLGVTLALWLGVYLLAKLLVFNDRPILGGLHTYLSITEMTLLSLTVWQAHGVARACRDFEEAVENITLANVSRRVRDYSGAADEIETEFIRSRRHHRPLSVVLVEPEPASLQARLNRTVREVLQEMMGRYVLATLAGAISGEVRRMDMVLVQRDRGRFVVLTPETTAEGSMALVKRIRATADRIGVEVACGTASFPDEAVAFDELMRQAEARLSASAQSPRPDAGVAQGAGGVAWAGPDRRGEVRVKPDPAA